MMTGQPSMTATTLAKAVRVRMQKIKSHFEFGAPTCNKDLIELGYQSKINEDKQNCYFLTYKARQENCGTPNVNGDVHSIRWEEKMVSILVNKKIEDIVTFQINASLCKKGREEDLRDFLHKLAFS